jgi:hypothetical protein
VNSPESGGERPAIQARAGANTRARCSNKLFRRDGWNCQNRRTGFGELHCASGEWCH